MVYYKVVLDDRRNRPDETYPVIIRVIHNRKHTSISTGVRIQKKSWLSSTGLVSNSTPNHQHLNHSITDQFLKVQKAVLTLENSSVFTFDSLKQLLQSGNKPPKVIIKVTFKAYSDSLIDAMLSINKAGNAIIYRTAVNRLMAFGKKPSLSFTEIDYTFLESFKQCLVADGVKQNTISNYFRTIRAIYNKAIKAKLVDRSHYPFLDVQIKTERTAKRAITIADITKIYNLQPKPRSTKWHARNYFLLSFSLVGASFTDLAYLKPSNIKRGRLVYKRRKTGKELSIKLLPLTLDLLEQYKDSNNQYLLPVLPEAVVENGLQAKKYILQWIKTTNKWLGRIAVDCEISDEITTYVARHSWATTAKRLGYANELIAESMGHEYGNKITNIYLDTYEQSVIDAVNENVVGVLMV
jgi:integrase/recombinase XerD